MTKDCMITGHMMSMARACPNRRQSTMMRWALGLLLKPTFLRVPSLVLQASSARRERRASRL